MTSNARLSARLEDELIRQQVPDAAFDREWLGDGRFSPNDAAELGWPVGESEEYEIIAGLCADLANHLPRPGGRLEKDGYVLACSRCVVADYLCCV